MRTLIKVLASIGAVKALATRQEDEPQEEQEVSLPELTWNGTACMAEDGTAHT